jgi:uncharacterized membrane protein YuzA (DUF378 family)
MDTATAAKVLAGVGAVNWGLVGLTKLDLVATLTGQSFGRTNAANRAVYLLVGAAGAYTLARVASDASA